MRGWNRRVFRRYFLSVGMIMLMLTACAGQGVDEASRHTVLDDRYRAVLERWTDQCEINQLFDTKLHAAATYKSAAFREAYTEKYARDYRLQEAEREKLEADQSSMAQNNLEFLVALAGTKKQDIDLTDKKAVWRVFLEGPALPRIEPFEVRKVKKTTNLESFFPYISPWMQVFQVRFITAETAPKTGELNLVLTGVSGTARLVYHLDNRGN